MRRTLLLGLLAALVLAWSWLELESAGISRGVLAWAVLVGVLPALPRRRVHRVAALALAVPLALRESLGTFSPGRVLDRFGEGFLRYYDVGLPFAPEQRPLMHALVLLAIFGFTLAVSLAVAERRPLLAAAFLVAGAAWPATLLPSHNELWRGAVILAAALAVVAGLAATVRARQAAVAAAALVAAAVGIAGVPAVAKGAFLAWETWDPYTKPDLPVSVRYVWEPTYEALQWPKRKTVVFRVQAPPVSRYWRATTLDEFHGDGWLEGFHPLSTDPIVDPLLPPAARDRSTLLRARVDIEGLQDRHLVAASVPVDYETGDIEARYQENGNATTSLGLTRSTEYTAYSYAPRPSPRALARSRPVYADYRLGQYLIPQSRTDTPPSPPFGRPGRELEMETIFAQNPATRSYRPLYERAREVVGATTSPYLAAVQLENWFRSGGGFEYDQTPPPTGRPVLVDFVTRTRAGYCQHFASAMALMLRYLGIPSRVAAGFTSGRYDQEDKEWVVTDHDAHLWVEVWFRGFGWLPFDPTPGRGTLDGAYSSASAGFDIAAVAAALRAATGTAVEDKLAQARLERIGDEPGLGRDVPGDVGGTRDDQPSLLRLLVLLALGAAALVVVVKTTLRRLRFLTRDPRRIASACRQELADYLTDQGVLVPPSATLAELGEIVRHEAGLNPQPFVTAVDAARYGPPRRAWRAARTARRELRLLERGIRTRLSALDRARGMLSLRSLGLT